MESNLPRWSVRLDASRPADNPGWSDIMPMIVHHYQLHTQAVEFLGPYNARQRGPHSKAYLPPSREELKAAIRQGRVNDFTYQAFIASLVKFCETTRGNRALPTPHPSVIHSIQLPAPAFELHAGSSGDTMVKLAGVETPIIVKNLRQSDDIKFIIVRPKLSKLGTASAKDWEVLFFKGYVGYIPEWVDTNLNPRYSGIY